MNQDGLRALGRTLKPGRKTWICVKPWLFERAIEPQRYAQFSLVGCLPFLPSAGISFDAAFERSSSSSGNFIARPFAACALVPCKQNEFGRKKGVPPLTLRPCDDYPIFAAVSTILPCAARGHSSVGRAVALQAIGQGFESPCLHSCGGQ